MTGSTESQEELKEIYFLNSRSIIVCIYLKVRAEGGQYMTMAGELLSLTAQNHITQETVETQPVPVETLQQLVGMVGVHKHLSIQGGRRYTGAVLLKCSNNIQRDIYNQTNKTTIQL